MVEKWDMNGKIHGISMGCTHGYGLKMGMDKITGVSKSMRDTQNGNLQNGNLASMHWNLQSHIKHIFGVS